MSRQDLEKALRTGNPYFGPYLACRKSWPHIYWYQHKLINYLSQSMDGEHISILEIGSWAGASAFTWCDAIKRYFDQNGSVVCVDIWDDAEEKAKTRSDDNMPPIKDVFLHNISAGGFDGMVQPIQSTSDRAFELLSNQYFDVVYIDGDHSYKQVSRDLENGLQALKTSGVICGDDLEIQADQIDPSLLNSHSESGDGWSINPETNAGYHPGVTRAVAERIGAVSSWQGFWATIRSDNGWENLELEGIEAPTLRPLMQYNNEGAREFDF